MKRDSHIVDYSITENKQDGIVLMNDRGDGQSEEMGVGGEGRQAERIVVLVGNRTEAFKVEIKADGGRGDKCRRKD